MNKIQIKQNLFQYQFEPFENDHAGYNIYAFINDKQAMLLDTGFEPLAKQVVEDLNEQGITVTQVVFSHFHPDHVSGIYALSRPVLYGSSRYQQSLDAYTPKEKHSFFAGMNTVDDDTQLSFGDFNLSFKLIQGHAICAMYTFIDDELIHVADDVMMSNDGRPLLPSVNKQTVAQHIQSLTELKGYQGYRLLLSHGNALSDRAVILQDIEQRLRYLTAIAESNVPLTVEQATANCDVDFLHQEWHNYVYL